MAWGIVILCRTSEETRAVANTVRMGVAYTRFVAERRGSARVGQGRTDLRGGGWGVVRSVRVGADTCKTEGLERFAKSIKATCSGVQHRTILKGMTGYGAEQRWGDLDSIGSRAPDEAHDLSPVQRVLMKLTKAG